MHSETYRMMARFKARYVDPGSRVVDVGSMDANGSYRPLFADCHYTGVDIDKGDNVDVVLEDPYHYPFPDNSADIVVSGQMLEHCERPWQAVAEMARILRPGGVLCIIAPSNGPVHRYPLDCYRYHPDGFMALARYAGLRVVECFTNRHHTLGEWWPKFRRPFSHVLWEDTVLVGRKA